MLIGSNIPPLSDGQFDCGSAPKLPSDAELKTWTPGTIFGWGIATNTWGNTCANKLSYNQHYIQCLKGNKLECTFVNQYKDTVKK
jgi:hypothetical protein